MSQFGVPYLDKMIKHRGFSEKKELTKLSYLSLIDARIVIMKRLTRWLVYDYFF